MGRWENGKMGIFGKKAIHCALVVHAREPVGVGWLRLVNRGLFICQIGLELVEHLVLSVDSHPAELRPSRHEFCLLLVQCILVVYGFLGKDFRHALAVVLVISEEYVAHRQFHTTVRAVCHQHVIQLRPVEREEVAFEYQPFVQRATITRCDLFTSVTLLSGSCSSPLTKSCK